MSELGGGLLALNQERDALRPGLPSKKRGVENRFAVERHGMLHRLDAIL